MCLQERTSDDEKYDTWLASYNLLKQRPVREFDLLGGDIPMKKSVDRPTREFDSIGSEFIVPDKRSQWFKKSERPTREFDSIGSEFIVPDKKMSLSEVLRSQGRLRAWRSQIDSGNDNNRS